MRFNASIFGLAACLGETRAVNPGVTRETPTTTAAASTTNTHISFEYNYETPHVYIEQGMLSWKVQNGPINVVEAQLVLVENDTFVANGTREPGPLSVQQETETDEKRGHTFIELHDKRDSSSMKRQVSQPKLPFSHEDTQGSVTIIPDILLNDPDILEKKMYLSLSWFDGARIPGKSFTTVFTVSNKSIDGTDLASYLQSIPDTTPYREEGYTLQGNPVILKNATSSAATQSTASAIAGSSTAPALPSNDDGKTQSGRSRLDPGAIAGIVIGSVIGVLLIIGTLAYFLCFRRRADRKQQRRHIHGDVGYASDSGAAAMMMREKDMSGVNHGSPQSAFADDGGRLHDRGGVAHENDSANYSSTPPYQEERGAAAGISSHQRYSSGSLPQNDYSLYNSVNGNGDQGPATRRPQSYAADSAIGVAVTGGASIGPNAERERNGSVGGGTVGRTSHQTSRPGSEVRSPSRYAHLIEEGMTEDEIRRLEDEERQLDAAIEDAGRHGRSK